MFGTLFKDLPSSSWRSSLSISSSHNYIWWLLISRYSFIPCYKCSAIWQSCSFSSVEFHHCIVFFSPHCILFHHCLPIEYNNLNPSANPLLLIVCFLLFFLLNLLMSQSLRTNILVHMSARSGNLYFKKYIPIS